MIAFGPRHRWLCANTDPPSLRYGAADPQRACPPKPWRRRNSLFSKGPADVLDHAMSEIAIDATKKLPGEGFKRPWPPLIKMDAAVKATVERLLAGEKMKRGLVTTCIVMVALPVIILVGYQVLQSVSHRSMGTNSLRGTVARFFSSSVAFQRGAGRAFATGRRETLSEG